MAGRLKAAERMAAGDREAHEAAVAALRAELAAEQEAGRAQTKASRAAAAAHADELVHCSAQAAELSAQVSALPSHYLANHRLTPSFAPFSCNVPRLRAHHLKPSCRPHR